MIEKMRRPGLFRFIFYILLITMDSQAAQNSGKKSNHLIGEKSPYLLQHAYNPVDWHPWGEAAIAQSRKEKKPILLSIGYSTCHWCHVMERESFSDAKLADILNKHFVSIKVDREERPDIDRVYMTAVQAMTGSGGWPLNVFLTPELKPFYGGTYFPPDSRWGRPSFASVLLKLADLWEKDRQKLEASGRELFDALERHAADSAPPGDLGPDLLDRAYKNLEESFDEKRGGFGVAPKFPMPVHLVFLFRYYARTGKDKAKQMALESFRAMARGGIFDQLGGGFHRYSTDARWHIPHFEKMLYDNAQLAAVAVEAFQVSHDLEFALIARRTLDYVLRDMRDPEGGFYSAEDADSLPPELAGKVEGETHEHKKEGAFYLWTRAEVDEVLGKERGELFSWRHGVEESGNAADDPQGEFTGRNILYQARGLEDCAKKFNRKPEEIEKTIEESAALLFKLRLGRPRPHRDEKILTSWNGLMISALARAGAVLDEPRYVGAAQKAADFIQARLYDPKTKTLYRRYSRGERKIRGMADDYAFFAQGLLDLYEASWDVERLKFAETLADAQLKLFYDAESGGFHGTAKGHDPHVALRFKEEMDNVEPSAAGIAALNLLRLSQFTGRKDFDAAARKTLKSLAGPMRASPQGFSQSLAVLDFSLGKPWQIVLAGKPGSPDIQALIRRVHSRLIPNKVLMLADGGPAQEFLSKRLPFLKTMVPLKGRAAAYACVDYACKLPTADPAELEKILQ